MSQASISNLLNLNQGYWIELRTNYCPFNSSMSIHKSSANISVIQQDYTPLRNIILSICRKSIDKTTISYRLGSNVKDSECLVEQLLADYSLYFNKTNHIISTYKVNSLTVIDKTWLVNSNVRLSMTTIYKSNKCVCVSFGTDIRSV
uniref:Uncharacterized protein n=1 Tax=Yamadaella caenomyce TaxID=259029 RepID=A0A1G4NYL5_9FLOR|nr:Hypothetical protein ycf58 [Yamadaella caenomyce]SCW23783.1 Hypothetical protein ycf58 [Yamadaella caenomyce]